MSKIKYLLSSKAFKKKPVAVIFRSLILLLSMIFRLKLKYNVDFKHNKFIYTFKPYVRSGLGGRGQYLSLTLYKEVFLVDLLDTTPLIIFALLMSFNLRISLKS